MQITRQMHLHESARLYSTVPPWDGPKGPWAPESPWGRAPSPLWVPEEEEEVTRPAPLGNTQGLLSLRGSSVLEQGPNVARA